VFPLLPILHAYAFLRFFGFGELRIRDVASSIGTDTDDMPKVIPSTTMACV